MKRRLHILHLEDNKMDAQLIYDLLSTDDFEPTIQVEESRESFTNAIENTNFDLILADYMLPSFDGLSALEILQEKQIDTPFIMISGVVGEEFAINSVKAGATDYVLKNGLTRLIPAIDRALKEHNEKKKRQEAEQKLEDNLAKLSALMQSAMDGVISVDEQGTIHIFNTTAENFFGYSKNEILGTDIRILIPEFSNLKHDCQNLIQVRGRKKDGTDFPLEISISSFHERDVVYNMLIVRDISERIENENLLSESQYYAQLGSWSYEVSSGKLRWTKETFRIFEFPSFENNIYLNLFLDHIHPDDINLFRSKMDRAIFDNGSFSIDHRINSKKGVVKWVHTRGKVVKAKHTNALKIEGTIQDITNRKRYEEALKLRNEELDNFVYRISHDLKAPICSIKGLVNLMKRENKSSELNEYIQLMHESISKQERFISQTLSYSKNLNTVLPAEIIDFEAIINEASESYKGHKNFNKTIFKTDIKPGKFYSDPVRLEIIFNNLISNALNYQQLNENSKNQVSIKVSYNEHEENAHIFFEDNGIGMDQETLTHIFDMFYRGSIKSDGSGIGLYILKQTVTKLEGKVNVTSQLDVGTRFEIVIPNRKLQKTDT